ncbi:MAG TPA: sigma-70 family RNA polymerase sigma factor [Candidatus Krumholzibacteria bacterium]|nr:sigma-70 family RNA polymerase sigma factor [Candidatus Krumholzibacteria bacterium]
MAHSSKSSGIDPSADDGQLLEVARGDRDAARRRDASAALLLRYRDAVYAWCLRYTRDPERALDLSQDVMLTAWEKIGSFEGRAKFSSWLFAVTRNRCIDASRRVDLLADELISEEHPDPAPLPDAVAIDTGGEDRLLALIRRELDPDEQKAIWLRCIERMPVEEITVLLGVSGSSGARALLQRARRKLRAALDRDERRMV